MFKIKKCKLCNKEFKPFKFAQQVCFDCALLKAREKTIAKSKKEEKLLVLAERKKHKSAKEKFLTARELKPKAQAVFNKYVRLRDSDLPCISCGLSEQEIIATGINTQFGIWDAGHYLSRGARPWLAFYEANCHKQCKSCNGGFKSSNVKSDSVSAEYRINLIEKIGLQKVVEIENMHDPKIKLTADYYRNIIAEYKLKIKSLRNKQ